MKNVEEESTARNDAPHPPHPFPIRVLCATLGALFVALGLAGVFLPVLPTTPFLLLAAACFARSSRRIHGWLLSHAHFGPLIHEWQAHRSMPYRAKRRALWLIAVSFAISITFFVPGWAAKLAMAAAGLVLGAWVARIPSRDAPPRR